MSHLAMAKCDSCARIEPMRQVGNNMRFPTGWASVSTMVHFSDCTNPHDWKDQREAHDAFDNDLKEKKKRLKEGWPKMHICLQCVDGYEVGQFYIGSTKEKPASEARQ